jgi:hypothetical protein
MRVTRDGNRMKKIEVIVNNLQSMKNLKLNILKFVMAIRLEKIIVTLILLILTPLIKYLITGSLHTEGLYIYTNIFVGSILFFVKDRVSGFLTDTLAKKGMNVSLKQILFGINIDNKATIVYPKLKTSAQKGMNVRLKQNLLGINIDNKAIIVYPKPKTSLTVYEGEKPFLDRTKKLSKKHNKDLKN